MPFTKDKAWNKLMWIPAKPKPERPHSHTGFHPFWNSSWSFLDLSSHRRGTFRNASVASSKASSQSMPPDAQRFEANAYLKRFLTWLWKLASCWAGSLSASTRTRFLALVNGNSKIPGLLPTTCKACKGYSSWQHANIQKASTCPRETSSVKALHRNLRPAVRDQGPAQQLALYRKACGANGAKLVNY